MSDAIQAPVRIRVFDIDEQLRRYRDRDEWHRIRTAVVAAIRPMWAHHRRECRLPTCAVGVAFQAYLAYWMYEPAPLGQGKLRGIVEDGCGMALNEDQIFAAVGAVMKSGWIDRSPGPKQEPGRAIVPNYWRWTGPLD